MGFMVAVDRCTLLCFPQLSVWFKESIWARNVIKNLEHVHNYLVVRILGCMIAGSPRKLKSERKESCPCGQSLHVCF